MTQELETATPEQVAVSDNWFVRTLGKVTNAPVIRHILREFSRPAFFVGNLFEGDIKNALTVLIPFSNIDDDEATLVSDTLFPKSTHWLLKLGADIITDPLIWTGVGGLGRVTARIGGLTKSGAVARSRTALEVAKKVPGAAGEAQVKAITTQVKSLADKLSVQLDDVADFGSTLQSQVNNGNRALITIGGNEFVRGEPIFKFLTKANEVLRATPGPKNAIKLFEDIFGAVAQSPAIRAYETALAGLNATNKYALVKTTDNLRKVIDDNLSEAEGRAFAREMSAARGKFKSFDENGILKNRADVVAAFGGDARKIKVHDAWASVVRATAKMRSDAGLPKARLGGDLNKVMQVDIPNNLKVLTAKMVDDVAKDVQPTLDRLSGASASMQQIIKLSDGKIGNPSQIQRLQIAAGAINEARGVLRNVMGRKVPNVQKAVDDLEKVAGKNFDDFKAFADELGIKLSADELQTVQTNLRSMKLISESMEGISDVVRTGKGELVGSADVTMSQAIKNLTPEQAQALVNDFSARSIGEIGTKSLAQSFTEKTAAILARRARIEKVMDELPPWTHHTLTLEAAEALRKLGLIQSAKKKGIDLSVIIPRKFRENLEEGVSRPLDLNEVNDIFRAGKDLKDGTVDKIRQFLAPKIAANEKKLEKLIDQGKVKNMQDAIDNGFLTDVANVFETDIRVIADTLSKKTVESTNVANHFTAAGKLFGRRVATTAEKEAGIGAKGGVELVDEIPPGWVQAPDNITGLDGVFLPPEIAQSITKRTEMFTNVESMNSLLRSYDQVQSFVKANLTVFWPAFHARNAMSNQMLKVMAGMNPGPKFASLWVDAVKLRRFSRNPAKFDSQLRTMKFTNGMDGHQMLEVMRRSRALDGSSMHREFPGLFPTNRQKVKQSVLKTPVRAYRKAAQAGSGTAGFIEDTDKIHMILWSLDEGLDEISAAERAIATLFDYGDVTSFEQNVFKRLFPFYSWSRKSIPSSLRSIAMNPGRLSAFTKLLDGIAVDDPIPEELLPNYVQDQFGVPVRIDDNGDPEFFLLESWVPFFELNKIPLSGQGLFDEFMAMLTPILKIPLEQGINKSFFFKQEITRFEGEKTEWLGFKGRFTKRQRHALSVIRALNEADNIIRATPLTPEDSFRRKQARDELLRFSTGIRLTKVDMERQKNRVKFERGREQATLQGLFNRAARNGDVANMEAVVENAREKGIELKTDQEQIDKVLARANQIEKGSKKSKAGGLESSIPGLPDIQKRMAQLLKEATE